MIPHRKMLSALTLACSFVMAFGPLACPGGEPAPGSATAAATRPAQRSPLEPVFGADRNRGSENGIVFQIPLKPGQYVYIANVTGQGKWPEGVRVLPLYYLHIQPDARGKWAAETTIWEDLGDRNQQRWRIRQRVIGMISDPEKECPYVDSTQRDTPEKQQSIEVVSIKDVNESKNVGRAGLEVHVIPYAKEDGQRHGILVAIGEKPESFKGAITGSWDSWIDLPTPPLLPK